MVSVTTSWSLEDKLTLLQSLRKHGTSDLMKIGEDLPFKSVTEIRNLIQTYDRLARKEIKGEMGDSNKVSPIDEWATFLRQHKLDYTNLMPLHRGLKYIALFEKRSEVNVNLTECYEYLSDLCNKSAPKDISHRSNDFLKLCLSDLARTVKNRDNDAELEFLANVTGKDLQPCVSYSSRALKRSAANDSDLNPMKIPKKMLTRLETDK